MTRGTFGEMTGAPDIVRHISERAGQVLGDAQSQVAVSTDRSRVLCRATGTE